MLDKTVPTLNLQRITTIYDLEQDRMRLIGQYVGNGTLTLWLTQRLLQRLLPVLWQWLERHDTAASSDYAPSGSELNTVSNPQRHEALQSFAQQAAQSQLAQRRSLLADEAVPLALQSLSGAYWLVHSVQLRIHHADRYVELYFSSRSATDMTPPDSPDTVIATKACEQITNTDGRADAVRLCLTAPELRQWLAIFLQKYRQADWPMRQWPQWLTETGSGYTASANVVLH